MKTDISPNTDELARRFTKLKTLLKFLPLETIADISVAPFVKIGDRNIIGNFSSGSRGIFLDNFQKRSNPHPERGRYMITTCGLVSSGAWVEIRAHICEPIPKIRSEHYIMEVDAQQISFQEACKTTGQSGSEIHMVISTTIKRYKKEAREVARAATQALIILK